MVLKGETIRTGAPTTCMCGWVVEISVCQSAAGYYVGAVCPNCGPYCRESGYYNTYEEAEAALESGFYWR